MKSLKRGKYILANVENITPFGIWLYLNKKEYFLSYKDYPYFKEQTIGSILNVRLLHGFHLYWPELDVDLELDNLENPEKYPMIDKVRIKKSSKNLSNSSRRREVGNLTKVGGSRKLLRIGKHTPV
jgi:hypothetical protein